MLAFGSELHHATSKAGGILGTKNMFSRHYLISLSIYVGLQSFGGKFRLNASIDSEGSDQCTPKTKNDEKNNLKRLVKM